MNTAIVMLGSNFQKEQNMERAKEMLSEFFEIVDESRVLLTKPVGKKYTNEFLNQALKLLSADTFIETQKHFKQIEDLLGRSPLTNMMGDVTIDIDLIFWNGQQKRNDYDNYDFVKECVDELLQRNAETDN
jgi:2-amino-4-hydroxy-6-hydroxymethyldihydropteridine diphosphokinase